MAFLTIRRCCCALPSTAQDFLTSSSLLFVARVRWVNETVDESDYKCWLDIPSLLLRFDKNTAHTQLFLICGHSQWNQRWWWWVFMKYFNSLQYSRACRRRFDSSLTTCSRGNWLSRALKKSDTWSRMCADYLVVVMFYDRRENFWAS